MAINKIDLTQVNETLQATFQQPMWLTTNTDDTTLALAAGTVEEVGGYLYRVEGADETVTDDGVPDGTAYIYINDPGTGVAVASCKGVPPTWSATKGGYYRANTKAIFVLVKSGTTYSKKQRLGYINGNRINGDLVVVNKITAALSEAKRIGDFTSNGSTLGLTEDDLFTELDSLFPAETGDVFPCCGSLYNRTGFEFHVISSATKQTPTLWVLQGMKIETESTVVVVQVNPLITKTIGYLSPISGAGALIKNESYGVNQGGTNELYWSLSA